MSTNFSNTLYITRAKALCIDTWKHTPTTIEIELLGAQTTESSEKIVRKYLAKRKDVAFAMVTETIQKLYLCTLPMDRFMENANKVNTRGENGRTRDPMMTRTVESTKVTALCVNTQTQALVNVEITLPGALDSQSAEKPVRKALANRKDVAFAMVTGTNVETAVYEMGAMKYYDLCVKYGEVIEKPFVPYVKRERKSKDANSAEAPENKA